LNRNFIGIEIADVYFEMAKKRIESTHLELNLVNFLENIKDGKSVQLNFDTKKNKKNVYIEPNSSVPRSDPYLPAP
jgi:hypothetical protein